MNEKVTLSPVAVLNFLHGAELRNQIQSKPLEPLRIVFSHTGGFL